jgi:hypothetical protein
LKIPYIATKPNSPGITSRDNPNIPWQLAELPHLPNIGFGWVCYGPKLALDWRPVETERDFARNNTAEFPNKLNLTSDKYGP